MTSKGEIEKDSNRKGCEENPRITYEGLSVHVSQNVSRLLREPFLNH